MAKEEAKFADGIIIQPAADYRTGDPLKYRATEKVYVDGTIYDAGETFVTDALPGKTWERITTAQKAAIDAGNEIKGDVDYAALSLSELKATAAALGLTVPNKVGLSKDDVIAIIKARDIPQT